MAVSKEYSRAWYQRNKERLAAKRASNITPEKRKQIAEAQAARRKLNPEKSVAYTLKYREKDRARYAAADPKVRALVRKNYYERNKQTILERHRENNYNVSPARYAELLLLQGGCCAICGVHYTKTTFPFSVDHDHSCCDGDFSCGECVRGLLCRRCNVGIGNLMDNVVNLRRAITYLLNPTTKRDIMPNPTSNLFAGLRDAKTFERGTWLKEGNYEVRVKRAIFKKTRAKGDAFILEVSVEKSDYEEKKKKAIAAFGATPFSMQELEKTLPNQPATTASWYQSMKDIDIGFGALKSFAASLLGQKPDNPEFIEGVEGFMNDVVNEGTINGMLIPVEVVMVKTKSDGDFSLHKWGQIIEETPATA